MSGKAYLSRKKANDRPDNDLYHTPFSLTWALSEAEQFHNVLDPCCGYRALGKALKQKQPGVQITERDLMQGHDFLLSEEFDSWDGEILMNPPFDLWDAFVFRAKELNPQKLVVLGRMNYYGCVGRSRNGIWNGLRDVYVFNRQVDYRTTYREDGLYHLGGLVTGWFVYERSYIEKPRLSIFDVHEYASLGQFKGFNSEKITKRKKLIK